MSAPDLKSVETHFEFGRNWQSFSSVITAAHIEEAKKSLTRLLPDSELEDSSFFDIGCGSGLSMLAAKELGARIVIGIDIDQDSIAASRTVLSKHLSEGGWSAMLKSVFDLSPERDGLHDVVYSWGVLHATGDTWTAIERASTLVKPKGYFVLALYRKTPFCRLWAAEKKIYTSASPMLRAGIRLVYKLLYIAGLIVTGRNPVHHIRRYKSNRGMDWHHDVHDWLGGYPYESVCPDAVARFLGELGFSIVRAFEKPAAVKGILGTHCDEFVAVRR
jgi:2-polyprenyl-3-methyl-5-hydroxy-6-metoxy-1,4-benzoquinol methylase